MNIQEAKQIKIADYLQSLGYTPLKQQGNNLWYKSPLREETSPSFKVNIELNQWYEFAIGKGGNIIALAEELYHTTDVSQLLAHIGRQTTHIKPFSFGEQCQSNSLDSQIKFQEAVSLTSPALITYLQERGVDMEIAKQVCKQIHFECRGRNYFAVGFANDKGGYELRNRYFKGCIAPKAISHIKQQGELRNSCYLFEGFMDYLSFLTIRTLLTPNNPRLNMQDYMILNSVSNLGKAESVLNTYASIHCFLDNDDAGKRAYSQLQSTLKYKVKDASELYRDYKDLNEYLRQNRHQLKPRAEQTERQKPRKRSIRI